MKPSEIYAHSLLLGRYDSYDAAVGDFEWELPDSYNVATDLVGTQPDPERTALIYDPADASETRLSFADVDRLSDDVAGLLVDRGAGRGDRVAVSLPKIPETIVTHMAVFKLGAVLVPLSELFGPEAMEYRILDCDATVLVTDERGVETITDATDRHLDHVCLVEGSGEDQASFLERAAGMGESITTAETSPDDPALLVYTSGTTSEPKGVLHGHRHLPSYYPAFEMANGLLSGGERTFWTPGDWAWVGSLLANTYCAWHYGFPSVAGLQGSFDADRALALIDRHGVTNSFLVPTALKTISHHKDRLSQYDLASLEHVTSGGEPLPTNLARWAEETLGVTLIELYGQTEANMILTMAKEWGGIERGVVGRPVPGADVRLVNDDGIEVPVGEIGEVALRSPHPTIFKEYLNSPELTAEKFVDDWMVTGDLFRRDEGGYFDFQSRKDDLILSSGYRISPAEVEAAVLRHDGVKNVAVDGKADERRGQIVVAYVVPTEDADTDGLAESIKETVREDVAKYKYPREVVLVEDIPTTTTGKIQRAELPD